MGKYSVLGLCIVPPCGRANTATLELNISPYCPPSHAIIYIYVSLVRSQLVYCSPFCRPYLLKDISKLKTVQRQATKLNDFRSDYKSRLIALDLLPLMYILELQDCMFCIQSLKSPTRDFNIYDFISFSEHGTRSSTAEHTRSANNLARHSYFSRIPRLWNSLPPIDLEQSVETIKKQLRLFLYQHFVVNFDPSDTCKSHFLCPCSRCIYMSHPPCF